MSTRPEFVQYLLDQLEGLGELRARKMFGDYLIYLNAARGPADSASL